MIMKLEKFREKFKFYNDFFFVKFFIKKIKTSFNLRARAIKL